MGAGIAGGADVILVPEIPYDINHIADAICARSKCGKHFSIVAVSEGAISKENASALVHAEKAKKDAKNDEDKKKANTIISNVRIEQSNHTMNIANKLEELCNIESRVTILGHLQRGGTPSAADRLLATRLGTACSSFIDNGIYGVMVASEGNKTKPVPLEDVVGKRKIVPVDHPWLETARLVGTCLGD